MDQREARKRAILERFPQLSVAEDVRWGLGFMVPAADLLEVAEGLKRMSGVECDFLSNITALDLKGRFQVVYHLIGIRSGAAVVLKVNVPAEEPEVESVTPVWPTANWHEREAFDLVGIRFHNHPDLRRILLWEGYEGHPLRKDFVDRRPRRERLVRKR